MLNRHSLAFLLFLSSCFFCLDSSFWHGLASLNLVISTQHHYSAQLDFDMHEFKLFLFSNALRYRHVFGIKWKKGKCPWTWSRKFEENLGGNENISLIKRVSFFLGHTVLQITANLAFISLLCNEVMRELSSSHDKISYTERQKKLITSSERHSLKSSASKLIIFRTQISYSSP